MVKAVEFIQKTKEICSRMGDCRECFLRDTLCGQKIYEIKNEDEIVHKVMEQKI